MRNKKIGQAEPALEVAQKVDDLRLDGNVRADMGSSHTMNSGSMARARAMQMRWR